MSQSQRAMPALGRTSRKPSHNAFAVVSRSGEDDRWIAIGEVYPHIDRGGFTIELNAVPVDGRIVCRDRPPGADDAGIERLPAKL